MKKTTGIIIILLSLIITTTAYGETKKQALQNMMNTYESTGFVTHKDIYGNYHVNGIMWQMLNAQEKEKVALLLALYNKIVDDNAKWADIYDSMSGRKIGKYGVFGFKAY